MGTHNKKKTTFKKQEKSKVVGGKPRQWKKSKEKVLFNRENRKGGKHILDRGEKGGDGGYGVMGVGVKSGMIAAKGSEQSGKEGP